MRLIDADAMRQDWLENGENEYVYDTNAFLDSIDEQPTIDAVEVVRCKDTGECRMFCCSLCGYGVNDIFVENEGSHLPDKGPIFNYCPNCGAKMDLEG